MKQQNNSFYGPIEMTPVTVKRGTQINLDVEVNIEKPKFKVGDYVFLKDYKPNWSEEVFVIKNVNNTAPCIYAIEDLSGE